MQHLPSSAGPSSPIARFILRLATLAAVFVTCPSAFATPAEHHLTSTGATAATMTDEQIEATFRTGCRRRHSIEWYRGLGSTHEEIGPLWLTKAGETQSRGVILPPFLRVYLLGRSRGCKFFDLDEARDLAGAETWVVLWRIWKPGSGSGLKALKPTQVRHRFEGEFHTPVWSRREDELIRVWFQDRWKETRSLVAAFAELPPKGSLFVDYDVEEKGQSYLQDSQIFSMTLFPKKWWARAHGVDPKR